jgi:imidazolonepropionase-like amidohydrolase
MSLGQDLAEAMSMRGPAQPGIARFFSAGLGITGDETGRMTSAIQVTTPAAGRAAVQKVAATKPDILKIWIDDRNGTVKKLLPEVYAAVIDEAHKNKLRVTAHIFGLEDAKGAVRAGLDAFAHVPARDKDVDDEFMGLLKGKQNMVLVPNLPDRGVRADLSWLKDSVPAAELQKLEAGNTDRAPQQQAFGIQARNLKKMSDAGLKVALGTDGNTPWQPHVEMADMVAAGLTPMQVIVASTKNGADFLRMTDAGTLEANKSADFLVLDANPLDDITNTRKISAVYLRGVAVDRGAMRVNQSQ